MNLGEVIRVWIVEPLDDPVEQVGQDEEPTPSPEPQAPVRAGA